MAEHKTARFMTAFSVTSVNPLATGGFPARDSPVQSHHDQRARNCLYTVILVSASPWCGLNSLSTAHGWHSGSTLSREKLDQSPTGRVETGSKRAVSQWTERLVA